jgi:hypothetical protein
VSRIVCATNAGEDSRAVHVAAFRRAAEQDSELAFLHVLGGSDYQEQPERVREAIRIEMEWLLHALVRVAKDRTEVAGVQSDVVLRTGDPRVEILAYLHEAEATMLLIGVPREGDASIFHESTFEEFVAEVEGLGVTVELVATGNGRD